MNNVFHNFFIPVFVAYIVVFLVVEFLGHRKCIYSPLLHTAKWFSNWLFQFTLPDVVPKSSHLLYPLQHWVVLDFLTRPISVGV